MPTRPSAGHRGDTAITPNVMFAVCADFVSTCKPQKFSDQPSRTPIQISARFEAALKSALNTPHKPLKHKPKVKKAVVDDRLRPKGLKLVLLSYAPT